MEKHSFSARQVAYTAIMTALVAVSTMVLKIQTVETYTNLGDTMIFLTAAFFGPVPALLAGGIGSFLADLITYPVTMWFTLVIKGLEGLIAGLFVYFANKIYAKSAQDKKSTIVKYAIYIIGIVIAAVWMAMGYYVAKAFMYGTKEGALISLPLDFVQGGLSCVLSIVLYVLLRPAVSKYVDKDKKKNIKDGAETNNNVEASESVVVSDSAVISNKEDNSSIK